jgi:hypothetical protein
MPSIAFPPPCQPNFDVVHPGITMRFRGQNNDCRIIKAWRKLYYEPIGYDPFNIILRVGLLFDSRKETPS